MVRIRQRWSIVLLGIGLGVGLVACKKDSTGTGDKSSEASGGPGGGDLAVLPADSEVVFGMNLAPMQQSALWASLVQPRMASNPAVKWLADIKAKCNYDPMTFKSIAVGAKVSADKPNGVAVIHGVDKAKAFDCLDKSKDDITKNGMEMTRDGDVALLTGKRGVTVALSFLNSSTAILVLGDKATAAGVKAVAAGGASLKDSAPFLDMYKKVKTGDTFWGLASGKVLEDLPLDVKATALYGSVNVTDGLALDGRVRFATPDAATQAANLINGQVKQAAQYVDKSDVTAEGNELHASVLVSGEKLKQLVPLLTMFAGGIPGMGGN